MLNSLNLDGTSIDSSILLKSVGGLPSLKTLSFQGSSQTVVDLVPQEFHNFTNLEELFLDETYIPRSLLLNMGALSSLKILSSNRCKLGGTLPDEERDALLQIKAWINHPNGYALSSWVEDDEDADCCVWDMVTCDTTTKRVIQLSLRSTRDWGLGYLDLNTSLFRNLKELKSLDLSSNLLVCCLPGTGALSLELRNLEVLDLSINVLDDSVLSLLPGASSLSSTPYSISNDSFRPDLGSLSNLEELDLSFSWNLKNFISPRDFVGLRMLKSLKLDNASIDASNLLKLVGGLPSLKTLSFQYSYQTVDQVPQELYNLTNLEELFLDSTYIPRSLLLNVGALSSLKILSLNRCQLGGTLPDVGLCELRKLEQLYLSNNELAGVLPPCMRNMTSLLVMDLSSNQLMGNIASSPLVDLISLQYLSVSSNQFRVPASFASFSNHSNLKLISCDNNELIPELNLQTSAPLFQLNFFSMSNRRSETRKAQFPYFLYFQHDLRVLDLSGNNFAGEFPSWLLQNNTRLERLYLKNNAFVGSLQLHYPLSNLSTFDISSNYMHAQGLKAICSNFPNLVNLIIADNGLTGGIPPCFENMTHLAYVDMSNNKLSSALFELFPLFGSSLWFLKLSNNNFKGQMSPTFFNQTSFEYLYLDNNNFSGHIPNSLSTKVFPELLDISNNHFSGMLPRWFGNLSGIEAIDFSNNHFHGSFPGEICNLAELKFLDLSENNLSGSIPSCTNLPRISHVHLYHNLFSGPLTYGFYNSSNLVTLDLRENQLTGTIPNWINSLSKLSILLLKGNNFDGDLPVELCSLTQLSILDLSNNMFSGPLPSCLSNINFTAIWIKNETLSVKITAEKTEDIPLVTVGGQELPPQGMILIRRIMWPVISVEEVIEFTTKGGYYSYKGSILNLMSGVDLSCNRFTGEIPPELGNMRGLRALNLSHNNLTGAIPTTFSNLKQTESLDLSHNGLTGAIPQQLTELHSLAVFSVAYNNLSGNTPEMKGQFGTFDQTSYEGNPLLCGPLLEKKCLQEAQLPSGPDGSIDSQESDGFMDMEGFYISFGLSYTTVVVTIAAVLCINSHWRRAWFYFIEMFITTCNSLFVDSFHKRPQVLHGRRTRN
ncbi:hypothetical protein Tsubulata_027068 [Turnera subulata]|uniref:Leucine-rich repeat-containing N-terminal plant-type domain-containing protein n=1 Tax=Turnera subulata TaxID=218843 RepID=A0A9Q0G0A4_9ROSI|nr:hypothetical protein Tsubulata_027068 [Turnera subulata]